MSTVIATFYNFGETGANKGRVRLISSSGSTPAVVSGSGVDITNTDPIAFYFNGGSSTGTRVLLVQRRYNASYVQIFCYLSVYDPSTWTQTVAPNSAAYQYSDGADLLNIYNLNSPGGTASGTLYGADYSAGRVFKLVHGKTGSTETLTLATPYYQFAATASGASVYSVDTVFNTESSVDYVYAVAQQYSLSTPGSSDPSDYTYYNSIIVKLNASSLTPVTGGGPSASLAPNVFDLQYYGGNLYATALGGAQWYGNGTTYPNTVKWNYASRIQKVTTGLTVTDLVRPANASETTKTNDMFDIRALAIVSATEVYILTGSYYTIAAYTYRFNGRLWKTTLSNLNGAEDDLITDISATQVISGGIGAKTGFLWALLPAADVSRVWGMLGDKLGVYASTGISGSEITAGTASEWGTTGSPAFNAISLAAPSITKLKAGAAPASVKSVRGFVHPLLASRAGVKPEDVDKFVSAHFAK